MRCGPKSIVFTSVFLLLLVCVLYVLFGDVSQQGRTFSFTAILKNFSIQSYNNGNQATVGEQTTATTQKPTTTTTTESKAAKLLFKTEYDRIEKNLKNGLQADDAPIDISMLPNNIGASDPAYRVYNPHFDSDANKALKNLVIANNQRTNSLSRNRVVYPNNALQMFNTLSNNIQSRLNNVNSLPHRTVPKLHVNYDNDVQYAHQNGKDLVDARGGLQVDINQLTPDHAQDQEQANQIQENQAQIQTDTHQMQQNPAHLQTETQQVPVGPAHLQREVHQVPISSIGSLADANKVLDDHIHTQTGAQRALEGSQGLDSLYSVNKVSLVPD